MERIISLLVENKFGVLARVAGLFSARGFNIESLSVGPTVDPPMSLITIVTQGDERILEQITKQLNKLIDVIKVQDLTDEEFIDRELMLVKMKNTPKTQKMLADVKGRFALRVIEENPAIVTFECTETRDNSKKLFEMFKEAGILEIAQTGAVALSKKTPKD